MSDAVDLGGSALNLFKVTTRLARGADVSHVVARDVEDALQQAREAYEDLNVLYIEAIERVGGSLFVSKAAKDTLT
jgi:hypothetical protein